MPSRVSGDARGDTRIVLLVLVQWLVTPRLADTIHDNSGNNIFVVNVSLLNLHV